MDSANEPMQSRIDSLTLLGGFVITAEFALAAIAALGLDFSQASQLGFVVLWLFGLPMYMLDVWLDNRVAVCLLVLLLTRWGWMSLSRPHPVLLDPLTTAPLLTVALILLQVSKVRRWRRRIERES